MSRIPEPDHTPDGPAYQGRLLDRADDEVVDQGARFDLGTLINRRTAVGFFGLGVGAARLAACTPQGSTPSSVGAGTATGAATASGEIPEETAGPYPGDGSNGPDVLERSGIVRSDIRSSLDGGTTADGVALTFTLTVLDLANGGQPFEGAAVYVWHCDALGGYSMYSDGIENESYLRGVQEVAADGTVTFTSIFPGCYAGRWPHIHFEVYPDLASITDHTSAIATSQLAFPHDACEAVYAQNGYDGSARNLSQVTLASDGIFADDTDGLQLATLRGGAVNGYTALLRVGVDTRTAAGAPGGRGGFGR